MTGHAGRLWTLTALLASVVVGCAPSTPPVASAPSKVRDIGAPPTEAECRAFAKAMESAARSGDAAAVNSMIDWDAILDQATSGATVSPSFKQSFANGFKGALNKPQGFAGRIVRSGKDGGSYTLLRYHEVDGEKRVLFRHLFPEEGVNYYDFRLVRRADGKVMATDLYVFMAGENFTQTIRRLFLPMAANESRDVLAKLVGKEADFVKGYPLFTKMSEAMAAGRFDEVTTLFRQLPASIQKEKMALLIRLQAVSKSSDNDAYLAVIDEIRRLFPGDACIDLLSVDGYYLRKQYDEAGACLDRVDKALGGDPYLSVLKATFEVERNRLDEAKAAVRKAIDAEPTLEIAHQLRLQISLKQRKFDDTLEALRSLRDKFGFKSADLESNAEYAEFVKSPQYKEWKKTSPP
jgi:tetratricopeptide (TPR) repeat protein